MIIQELQYSFNIFDSIFTIYNINYLKMLKDSDDYSKTARTIA